jgi:peptidase C25-like protein
VKTTTRRLEGRAGHGGVRVEVAFDEHQFRVHETRFGMQVELEGCRPAGEPGGPALPRAVVRVALPLFHWPASVGVQSERFVAATRGPTLVAPMQLPRAGTGRATRDDERRAEGRDDRRERDRRGRRDGEREDNQCKSPPFRPREDSVIEPFPVPAFVPPDPALYERASEEPPPLARHVATQHVGLIPVATIELNPVRYASDGSLGLAAGFAIEIITVDVREIPQEIRLDPAERERLRTRSDRLVPMPTPAITSEAEARRLVDIARELVVNPKDVWDYAKIYPVLEFPAEHLIITDNSTWNAQAIAPAGAAGGDLVSAFRRLSSWKAKRGVSSKVVTITDIVGGRYGDFRSGAVDLQEVLRNFVRWAKEHWGVCWVLLGGDADILPVRIVAGRCRGDIGTAGDDPPKDNASFWTGSYLKMKVVNAGDWWVRSKDNILVRPDTGEAIRYDPTGMAAHGWHFATDDSYVTASSVETDWVRVNGPAGTLDATLQWLYHWNQIPTDLYYSSLYCFGIAYQTIEVFGYKIQFPYVYEPAHHWDIVGNGVYGQYYGGGDLDGVIYRTDVSVGRAAVSSRAQADAFVDKVISYESFRDPSGGILDLSWPGRLLLASTDWGGSLAIYKAAVWPADDRFHHGLGDSYTLIKTKDVQGSLDLIAEVSDTDRRVMPHLPGGGSARGWYHVWNDSNPTPSEITIPIWGTVITIPIPTTWVRVQGSSAELEPARYLFDDPNQDGSMHDQEQLRAQIAAELPALDELNRFYEDELDLSPGELAAGPVAHITSGGIQTAMNAAPHIVSLSGHGNAGWCCDTGTWTASALTNGHGAFIGYADSCLTNAFDESDSLSEALLDNPNGGAVGYVGNTRFSWIGMGDEFQRAFFHRLTTTQHLGLLNDSRCQFIDDTSFNGDFARWIIFALNLLGDPEMPVRRGRYRRVLVKYADTVDRRKPFDIHVYEVRGTRPVPIGDAVVHLEGEGLSQLARTDADGVARFHLSHAPLGEVAITVTGDGLIPEVATTTIAGPDWISGRVLEISHQEGSPERTLVRLEQDGKNGGSEQHCFAHREIADYGLILDAVTDAYVAKQPIALFVTDTRGGGRIERFKFGE